MPDILRLGDGSTTPRIAWRSALAGADLTSAALVANDGAVEHALDWTPWTFWRTTGDGPHTVEADLVGTPTVTAWAIAGHDAAGLVAMDTWDGSAWIVHSEAVLPGDGAVAYLVGDPVATARLRFRFAVLTHLAVLWAGVDLVLPAGVGSGWTDPVLALRADLAPEVTRDGVWLGAAVTRWSAQLSLDVKQVEAPWARDHWLPFLRRCSTQPFLLHWHRTDWPGSACLCTNARFGSTAFSGNGLVDLSVEFTADPGLDRRLAPIDDVPALLTEPSAGPLLLEGA